MRSVSGKLYTKGNQIGKGTYGIVCEVTRDDGNIFAYKEYTKNDTGDMEIGALREISILKIFQGTNMGVVELEDIIIDNKGLISGIIMKKYTSNLLDKIDDDALDRPQRKKIARKLTEIVFFLHTNNIMHRDIKPENVLLDDDNNPVLADYTLSKVFDGDSWEETHSPSIATETYRAPEVYAKKPYDFSADIWSLGVVMYELFSGNTLPQQFDDVQALEFLIKKINRLKKNPLGVALKGMLTVSPKKRWTIKDVLQSKLFNSVPSQHFINIQSQRPEKVNKKVLEICRMLGSEKTITTIAAQTYINTTNCTIQAAAELACKVYETKLIEIDRTGFIKDEANIIKKMNYNLFV